MTTSSDLEEWRPVLGYEGFYEVSSYGRVRSYYSGNADVPRTEPRILKPSPTTHGYLARKLCVRCHEKTFFVHTLVATAFLGASDLQVNHKDGDKTNNYIGNLEYCTRAENMRHAREVLGLDMTTRGERHGMSKYTDAQVIAIRELTAQGARIIDLMQQFGISKSHLIAIRQGRARRMAEMITSPNSTSGERHFHAKLTDAQVDEIRQLIAEGLTNQEVAERFDVTHRYIGEIRRGKKRRQTNGVKQAANGKVAA